jgi:hypothetical protein
MSTADRNRARNHFVWVGATISFVALISYFTYFARFPGLRDTPWLNLLAVVVGLGLSIAAIVRRRSVWSIAGGLFSILCATALIGYVYILSFQLPASGSAVAVGARAPSFELSDSTGRLVQLDDYLGSRTVVVFYRGFW